ncbi:MAG: hypothetical protein HYT12_02050 [Candidatus Liptonbacteria bacterium]|nr:hypothetical protein [Candidatus Liptonbacteria bacterium]
MASQQASLRAWQELVDRVVMMEVEPVLGQNGVFKFTGENCSPVILRITRTDLSSLTSGCDDGLVKTVELLDVSGQVLAKEEWIENYSIYAKNEEHPLDDLLEFVENRGSSRELQSIRAIKNAIAS